MKENLHYRPKDSETPQILVSTESANDPVFGDEFNENDYIITETIIADDEFAKPPRLTRENFNEEAIIARKKSLEQNSPKVEVTPITETIIADEQFNQHRRLTREDFTPEAIERARLGHNIAGNLQTKSVHADQEVSKAQPEKPRLTRADFPGTGSAKMPELVYKKDFFPAPKKSLFRRMIPNFISKWFK